MTNVVLSLASAVGKCHLSSSRRTTLAGDKTRSRRKCQHKPMQSLLRPEAASSSNGPRSAEHETASAAVDQNATEESHQCGFAPSRSYIIRLHDSHKFTLRLWPAAPAFACISTRKCEFQRLLDSFAEAGIGRLMQERSDPINSGSGSRRCGRGRSTPSQRCLHHHIIGRLLSGEPRQETHGRDDRVHASQRPDVPGPREAFGPDRLLQDLRGRGSIRRGRRQHRHRPSARSAPPNAAAISHPCCLATECRLKRNTMQQHSPLENLCWMRGEPPIIVVMPMSAR